MFPPHARFLPGFAILVAVFVVSIVTAGNNWNEERKFRKLNEETMKEVGGGAERVYL